MMLLNSTFCMTETDYISIFTSHSFKLPQQQVRRCGIFCSEVHFLDPQHLVAQTAKIVRLCFTSDTRCSTNTRVSATVPSEQQKGCRQKYTTQCRPLRV